jgi:cysteinyl-tRNA synthetase
LPPDIWCKATDYIQEQIDMVVSLEKKGYTYRTDDGIYFDTSKVKDYNKLSHLPLEQLREGARVEKNEQKKNPTDFALWKFSPEGSKRQMEWDSPWGIGFPGWHLECSAMSLANLPGHLDIHCGGIDHLNIHHTNEIAQSEAATGQKFFNYWLHGAFPNIAGGEKLAKSEGNFLTVQNALIKEGIAPLAFRFAALQVHYRKPMEYSQESFKQADNALSKLRQQVQALGKEKGEVQTGLRQEFQAAIADDLNLAKGLAVLSSVFRAKISDEDKLATALDFDKVLGLGLDKLEKEELELSKEAKDILEKRSRARADKDFVQSDILRDKLLELGYKVKDTAKGQEVERV